jgi:hypothetical protein
VILEGNADLFLHVLEQGTVSTNVFLRRLHNFALDMSWLPWPVLPKRQWPDGSLSDGDTELKQLSMNPGSASQRVGVVHFPDQSDGVWGSQLHHAIRSTLSLVEPFYDGARPIKN